MNFTGERFIPEVDGWLALQHYHRYHFVFNQLDLKGKVVLDIACGDGYGSEILSQHSKFVYGIDISTDVIQEAKARYEKPNLEFLVGHTSSIPLPDESIDLVVSFETIEHHDEHSEMMQEIKRVLKKEGILIISSPDKKYYEDYLPTIKNEFHVKELYYEEFVSMMKKYFKYCTFFMQNNIIGSFIINEDENCHYKRPVKIEKSSGLAEIVKPRFNICIASDFRLVFSSSISFCSDIRFDDVLNDFALQRKLINNIYRSKTWKFARIISFPFRKFRNLISTK